MYHFILFTSAIATTLLLSHNLLFLLIILGAYQKNAWYFFELCAGLVSPAFVTEHDIEVNNELMFH